MLGICSTECICYRKLRLQDCKFGFFIQKRIFLALILCASFVILFTICLPFFFRLRSATSCVLRIYRISLFTVFFSNNPIFSNPYLCILSVVPSNFLCSSCWTSYSIRRITRFFLFSIFLSLLLCVFNFYACCFYICRQRLCRGF